MRNPREGFTLIELVVALVLSIFVVEIAWNMLGDQKSNLVGVRQRLRAQAVAREALKTMESEIRIAGYGQKFQFAAGAQGRVDSLGASGLSNCSGLQDANGSSVSATDGANNYNDTLTVAYPMAVSPTTGTDCSQIQWSRYYVDGSANLIRLASPSLAGLATSTSTSIVAKGVDVFQVRLGVMGPGVSPSNLLVAATEACCAVPTAWTSTNAVHVAQGTSVKITPSPSSTWSFLSATKSFKAGEHWRDTIFLEPNAAFFNDLHAKGATLTAGIYQTTGAAVATVNLLTIPATDSSLSVPASGLAYSFDLVVPSDGNFKLGLVGVSGSTASTSLRVQTMNAAKVGLAPGTSWWKDPSAMVAADWAAVKQLELIIVSRSESMEDARATTLTGLANFVQGGGPTGQFTASDKQVRAVFDHIYPVGNNGSN